ncbi:MAG: hypothetical protein AB1777_09025 [Bacteroidota bacterium]
MKTIKLLLSATILFLIAPACDKVEEYSLSGTIFIEDPYFPGLPIYSEWGYNTFGAYIDRKPFVSTSEDLPAKVIVNSDTIHLIFRGKMGSENVDLKFSIKGYSPQTYYDLTELDNTTLNLKDSGREVTLKIGNTTTNLNLIEGELIIKRVQRLYVDEELSRTIMSGYFNLKTFLNNEPISISQGRFDLGIGYENFFNY